MTRCRLHLRRRPQPLPHRHAVRVTCSCDAASMARSSWTRPTSVSPSTTFGRRRRLRRASAASSRQPHAYLSGVEATLGDQRRRSVTCTCPSVLAGPATRGTPTSRIRRAIAARSATAASATPPSSSSRTARPSRRARYRRYGSAHATGTVRRGARARAGRHRAEPVHRHAARRHGRGRPARRPQGRRRHASRAVRPDPARPRGDRGRPQAPGGSRARALAGREGGRADRGLPAGRARAPRPRPGRRPRAQPAPRLRPHDRLRPGRPDGAASPATTSTTSRSAARSARSARHGERPLFPLNLVGDYGGGGMLLAFGVVCGLLEARASGEGQVVDAAMVEGTALLTSLLHGLRAAGGWQDTAGTNLLDSGAHFYEVYDTSDGGHVAVGAIEPQFYARLLELLELDADDFPPVRHGPLARVQGALRGGLRDAHARRMGRAPRGRGGVRDRRLRPRRRPGAPAQPGARHLRRARRHGPARRGAALRPHPGRRPPATEPDLAAWGVED